jgi:hypothetical protein
MSSVYPIDRAYKITPYDDGNFADFGPGSFGASVGTVGFHFEPDVSFEGGVAVMARGTLKEETGVSIPDPPFGVFPYRAGYLNGAVPAVPFTWDTQPITGRSLFHVPSNGLSIGLAISCTAGFGWLYSWPIEGPSAV